MTGDLAPQKRALRAELRERRHNMTRDERAAATQGFTEQLVALTRALGAKQVSCYLSAVDAPNTRPFANWARSEGLRVLFPITRTDGLLDWTTATDEEEEVLGLAGTPEPLGELLGPIAINDVDLIVVPAAS